MDWLALQLLPDTAETEWLDRHGSIWLVNSDGSTGRKGPTLASGSADFTGIYGTVIPVGTQLRSSDATNTTSTLYETTQDIVVSSTGASEGPIRAIDPGSAGNQLPGAELDFATVVLGADSVATVVTLTGGADTETDNELRARILQRIRNPPMGGDQEDYIAWALAVPGVTRAWAASEVGIGTITLRFLMDDLRASDNGWPTSADIQAVSAYINQKRPVTVKDCFVVAPIKQFIAVTIKNLEPDTEEVRAEIQQSIEHMLFEKAAPGQTIFAAWINYAIMSAPNVDSFQLLSTDDYVMAAPGYMAVLDTIVYK